MNKKKFILLMFVIGIIFIFPQSVKADDREVLVYFELRESGELQTVFEEIKYIGEFSAEERAFITFDSLFKKNGNLFVPEGTQILSATIIDRTLFINASKEIKGYGGVYYEKHMRAQIVRTALMMNGIDQVTLLIEGYLDNLPEGMNIDSVDEWEELMD